MNRFCKYITNKIKATVNMSLQLHRQRTVMKGTEKTEVLTENSVSVFTGKSGFSGL